MSIQPDDTYQQLANQDSGHGDKRAQRIRDLIDDGYDETEALIAVIFH